LFQTGIPAARLTPSSNSELGWQIRQVDLRTERLVLSALTVALFPHGIDNCPEKLRKKHNAILAIQLHLLDKLIPEKSNAGQRPPESASTLETRQRKEKS
jgi:hypothetical protein